MISLETAKKLKEAGLKWEPKVGDWFYNHHGFVPGTTTTLDLVAEVTVLIHSIARDYHNRTVEFAPRLDQLLAEIERLGWEYELRNDEAGIDYVCFVFSEGYNEYAHANTPTNAAAEALLWIYERRNQHES